MTLLVIREMQKKSTTRYHYKPPEWLKLRRKAANVGKDSEQLELSYTAGRNGKGDGSFL